MKNEIDSCNKESGSDYESFRRFCRRHGLAATHQRQVIFRELAGSRLHPDAATIYRGVKQQLPSISLDTVYRTLRTFTDKGMAAVVTTVNDAVRYDADVSCHSHFVCRECGCVLDVEWLEEAGLRSRDTVAALGQVESVRVEYRGICKECRNKELAARSE